jgi:hypothetical protein
MGYPITIYVMAGDTQVTQSLFDVHRFAVRETLEIEFVNISCNCDLPFSYVLMQSDLMVVLDRCVNQGLRLVT